MCCSTVNSAVAGRATAPELHQPEIEHLHEVVVEAHAADVDIGRLDVAMDEAARVRVGQRVAHLAEQEHRAFGGQRTEFPDQRFEVASGQQLHHVVERAIVGQAEVEQLNRVRGAEGRGRLGFALEPAHHELGFVGAARAEHFGPYELDGRVPGEQPVLRPPDLAHAAVAEPLDQPVAAQILAPRAAAGPGAAESAPARRRRRRRNSWAGTGRAC